MSVYERPGRPIMRRQHIRTSTWRRRETAAAATAVRRLSRAVLPAPSMILFLSVGQSGNLVPALVNAMNVGCARADARPRRTGEQREHR